MPVRTKNTGAIIISVNTKERLLQLVKTPAPPLEPMPMTRKRPVTVLVGVTNLRRDKNTSNKIIKRNHPHTQAVVRLGNL